MDTLNGKPKEERKTGKNKRPAEETMEKTNKKAEHLETGSKVAIYEQTVDGRKKEGEETING